MVRPKPGELYHIMFQNNRDKHFDLFQFVNGSMSLLKVYPKDINSKNIVLLLDSSEFDRYMKVLYKNQIGYILHWRLGERVEK